MGSRAIQLALIIALGAGIGLLIARPWRSSEPVEAPAGRVSAQPAPVAHTDEAAAVQSSTTARTDSGNADTVQPPPARPFRLPAVAAATPVVTSKRKEETDKRPTPILVPRHWLLRGTGPQGYDVKSDRAEVFTGQVSVQLVSHEKNVAATKFASLMQTVLAEPWVGKRVEFSMSTKSADLRRRHFDIWIRATDAGGAVIAYDHFESLYEKPEWKKGTVVMDIPWSAAEIAYGMKLTGSGTVWVDNAQIRVVEKSVEVTGRTLPSELGVIVQVADRAGPLAMPSNLDFEDLVPADESYREVPTDALGRTRF